MTSGTDWLEKYFSVQVFFIIFRETIETVIIISVLLAFLNQGFGEKALHNGNVTDDEGQPLNPSHYSTDSNASPSSASNTGSRPATSTSQTSPSTLPVNDSISPNAATSSQGDDAASLSSTVIYDENVKLTSTSRSVYRRLVFQVWIGAVLGLVVCFVIGSFFVYAFYHLGKDLWGSTEKLWEAFFSIFASLIITFMGATMLRINKLREKWRIKIGKAIIETHSGRGSWGLRHLSRKYAMGILPFITTLREGLEAVVFLGGLGVNQAATSFPLPAITAILLGSTIGWGMYKTGDHMSIQYFLMGSTCFLYLVAAGLLSRGVWFYEDQQFINRVGMDISEQGSGPGSYDISKSVWHVNCCNPETDGAWMIFNALLGWQNSATYASVLSYNFYWIFVILYFFGLKQREETGFWPYFPKRYQRDYRAKYNYSHSERQAIMSRATQLYTLQDEYNDVESNRRSSYEEEDDTEASPNQTLLKTYNATGGSSSSKLLPTGSNKRSSHESLSSNTPLIDQTIFN